MFNSDFNKPKRGEKTEIKNFGENKRGLGFFWAQEKILFGHSGKITCFSSSIFHNFFASSSVDGSIRLWDSYTFLPLGCLSGSLGGINCISFDKKFGNFFSGGDDMEIKCWDLETQKVSRKFKGHFSSVTGLAIHPLMNILFSGGRDCTTRVWDLRIKKEIKIFDFHTNTISSILANQESPHLITSSLDGTICLWDLVSDSMLGRLDFHDHGVIDMKKNFSELTFSSLSKDSLIIWRSDGTILKKIRNCNNQNSCFSLNGIEQIAVSTNSGWIKFYDFPHSRNYLRFRSFYKKPKALFSKSISALNFYQTPNFLLIGKNDKTIQIVKKKWKNLLFWPNRSS